MNQAKLSFVVPVYNPKEAIFRKCVQSLVDQSLKEWEAIFVLDGPCPLARTVINSVMKKKPNHFKIVEIEHGGACKARNAGFPHTKGPIVCFWDADCVIEPHAARAWVDIFEAQSDIGFIYSGYKFLDEQGGISGEPFDPWLLRVGNYISTCFPFRRELFPGWNEDLKSLQDWDFWLSVVEKGAVGKFMNGYAFSTAYPDSKSISGINCRDEVWLDRFDAVKKAHGLPNRDVCVSSLAYKQDGLALAKYIDADYRDIPNYKPHRYKSIIQVGFSLNPARVETHAKIFSDKEVKKFIFWQPDDIFEVWNRISLNAISKYAILLNDISTQFVEDAEAKRLMERAGFKVSILPMPIHNDSEIKPLPEKPRFAVDIDPGYSEIFRIIDKSLPDISLEVLSGQHSINDFTGLIHFFCDKTTSNEMKRAALTGRHVISNVKGYGFVDDQVVPEIFIKNLVNKIRQTAKCGVSHAPAFDKAALLGVL